MEEIWKCNLNGEVLLSIEFLQELLKYFEKPGFSLEGGTRVLEGGTWVPVPEYTRVSTCLLSN